MRLRAPLLGALAVLAGALALGLSGTAPAGAASGSGFRAGLIISDGLFYNSTAMTAAQVQKFLNGKVPQCHEERSKGADDPIVCLKNFSQKTTKKPADSYCSGYSAVKQTAAQIINGVARSCGVSQKALLVLVQKESQLVTHTYPSRWRYQSAMGYGCPDTAACDSQYKGFFNQVYNAARQFRVYRANPDRYGYVAGMKNYIQYNPDASCGGRTVYIENQATAGLYNYTPYVPNTAALNAGYGTGNACSAYGNRNFYLFYTDWFGSTTGARVLEPIRTAWQRLGGANGPGSPLADAIELDGGVYQRFTNGYVVVTDNGKATYLPAGGAITKAYFAKGGPRGTWGWPKGSAVEREGIWRLHFTGLTAYNRDGAVRTSAIALQGRLVKVWYAHTLAEVGRATSAPSAESGSVWQELDNGYLYRTEAGAGAYLASGWRITKQYLDTGGPEGAWGWPTGNRRSLEHANVVKFDQVSAYGFDGTVLVPPYRFGAGVFDEWYERGGEGELGLPREDAVGLGSGSYQRLARGYLFVPSRGSATYLAASSPITDAYLADGGPDGSWGWPTTPQYSSGSVRVLELTDATAFLEDGTVSVSTVPFGTGVLEAWLARGGPDGLGLPSAEAVEVGGGAYQLFGDTYLFVPGDGPAVTLGAGWRITGRYLDSGGPTGSWGWPTADPVTREGANVVTFAKVTAYGYDGRVLVTDDPFGEGMFTLWRERGGQGALGLPDGPARTASGGRYQHFTTTDLFLATDGSDVALGRGWRITQRYWDEGGPSGAWGWPRGGRSSSGETAVVEFEGAVAFGADHRVLAVEDSTGLLDPWRARGGVSGLGVAVAPSAVRSGGTFQRFTKGWLLAARGGSAVELRTSWYVTDRFWAAGGPPGSWGWPVADRHRSGDAMVYEFQHVTVYGYGSRLEVVKK
ncbi:hypothetical protein H9L10_02680 [Phycicoccus endophyticus]|uniref:LGFP repeat-containing protein n=1 Tax=Phycicoccus endophyticus TaxID=1690220 RepID=A0A7G9R327_9MICO|nr:hypothetical protein [Phycicoccus endophyticus]QNN50002.1 hypothetical protein H9L10_02680 [Phycicoccus endophyticus]GGL28955.1 hypothetical protein GCM10012283_09000 [Phycicoccus endophyticus]